MFFGTSIVSTLLSHVAFEAITLVIIVFLSLFSLFPANEKLLRGRQNFYPILIPLSIILLYGVLTLFY